MKRLTLTVVAIAAGLSTGAALAQGYGHRHEMMQGEGHGPGMMQGYGHGPGMGMMEGQGGRGPGMMGAYGLDLSPEQEDKVLAIREEHRRKNWDAMGKLEGEEYKLRRLENAGTPDTKAIVEQQKRVDELRREMLASRLEMRKEMEAVLTPEQRKQLRR